MRRFIPTPATLLLVGSLFLLIAAGWQSSGQLKITMSILNAPVFIGALILLFRATNFTSPRMPNVTPKQLAWIRILVCLTALTMTVVEDLPGITRFPIAFRVNYGSFGLLSALPGYLTLISSSHLLAVLQWLTAVVLFLAMIGWRTRINLLLGALGFFLVQAILRQHVYFFHTGLVPLYLLCVLPWTPCGVAWSVDARLHPASAPPSARLVGFGIYACLIILAVPPYFLCGLSKLRTSGLGWVAGENLRHKLIRDTLEPVVLGHTWDATIWLVQNHAPTFVFGLIGVFGIVIELGYVTILFSRTARIVIPIMAFAMHIGVVIFQHILFFDLLILQFIFFNADRLGAFVSRAFHLAPGPLRVASNEQPRAIPFAALAALSSAVAIFFAVWIFEIEFYPLSSWRMYSDRDHAEPVTHHKVIATLDDGRSVSLPMHDYSPAVMPKSRVILDRVFSDAWLTFFEKFFSEYATIRNHDLAFGARITSIQIEQRRWDYSNFPSDPDLGSTVGLFSYDVSTGHADRR
ncbi:MAG: hypothetical protein ABJB69_02835 [Spartobacteria bacterium]